jgi:hypothetical protein
VAQQIDVAREYCQHHNLVLDKLYVEAIFQHRQT